LNVVREFVQKVGSCEKAVPVLLDILHGTKIARPLKAKAGQILAGMKGRASEAVPVLLNWISDDSNKAWLFGEYSSGPHYCQVLAAIAPETALSLCRQIIEGSGKNPRDIHVRQLTSALRIAKFIGRASVPMLLDFGGTFSGERGKLCKAAADEISRKGRLQPRWGFDGESSDDYLWISSD